MVLTVAATPKIWSLAPVAKKLKHFIHQLHKGMVMLLGCLAPRNLNESLVAQRGNIWIYLRLNDAYVWSSKIMLSNFADTFRRFSLRHNRLAYFLLWLFFFSVCIVSLSHHIIGSIALALGLSILFFLFALILSSLRGLAKFAACCGYTLLAIIAIIVASAYRLNLRVMGALDTSTVRAVAQTDVFEALHYLRVTVPFEDVALAGLTAFLLVYTFPPSRSLPPLALTSRYTAVVPIALAALLVLSSSMVMFETMISTFQVYKQEVRLFEKAISKRNRSSEVKATTNYDGTIIVIVGESTARMHMGLYGYFRDTTPRLLARKDDLIVFPDVVSHESRTVPVLTTALTLAGTRDDLSFENQDAIDIISLARAAGYETFWFSNQNEFGTFDTPVSILAKTADHARFISPTVGEVFRRLHLDHEMLPLIDDALVKSKGTPKVIFVHLFATHVPYCEAYPETFAEYTETIGWEFYGRASRAPDVNCYDNAVRYVDWMVDSVIQKAEASDEPVGILYFSDHGEAPLLNTFHDERIHSAYHVEVPLIFWFNKSHRDLYRDNERVVRENSDRPYSLARLFHSLGDLLQIDSEVLDPRHSVLSDAYTEQDRKLLGGRISYDTWSRQNDYRENSRVFMARAGPGKEKIWAHRINSLGALMEAKEIFDGVELDVLFNRLDGRFHVFHPPAPDTGLTLNDVLDALEAYPEMQLWLDWKNGTAGTLEAALARLNELDAKYNLKNRILVETDSNAIFEGIEQISATGYTHGYYLPTNTILNCQKNCTEDQQKALAQQIKERVARGKFGAVTYDWRLRPFVEAWLDDFLQQRGLKQYSWDMSIVTSRDISKLGQLSERVKMLDGLLVTFPSVFRI